MYPNNSLFFNLSVGSLFFFAKKIFLNIFTFHIPFFIPWRSINNKPFLSRMRCLTSGMCRTMCIISARKGICFYFSQLNLMDVKNIGSIKLSLFLLGRKTKQITQYKLAKVKNLVGKETIYDVSDGQNFLNISFTIKRLDFWIFAKGLY